MALAPCQDWSSNDQGGWQASELDRAKFGDDGLLEAVDMGTTKYGFCPNRIWAAAQSFKRICDLPILLRPDVDKHEEMFCSDGKPRNHQTENHKQCGIDFCEQSQVNFTSIPQRHESPSCKQGSYKQDSCKPCEPLDGLFPRAVLEKAFDKEKTHENDQDKHIPTAWQLNGAAIVEDGQKYMAISHVWSDGTGAGAWDGLKVNKCLYHFFRKLAWEEFGCEGIWWDTICIPGKKKLRAKALATMHVNYEKAEVTFVHDCFLRSLPWVNAETACIAILMSPWFSRGWTALELAKSKTVKVAFKGNGKGNGKPDIKDLDEDILIRDETSDLKRHEIASGVMSRLRKKFRNGSLGDGSLGNGPINIDELLLMLSSRHTSWARDMAIISAHLVKAEITGEESQQDIYKKILKKVQGLRHAHLFHNLPTMSSGPSWSPVSLFNMPRLSTEPKDPPLIIEGGEAVGKWKIVQLGRIPKELYVWKDIHPFITAKIRAGLKHEDQHVFLVEPSKEELERALLVKLIGSGETIRCQFVGSMYFDQHPKQLDLRSEEQLTVTIVAAKKTGAAAQDDHNENGETEGRKGKSEDKRNNSSSIEDDDNNSFGIKDHRTTPIEQQNSQPQQTEKQMETEAPEATSESEGEDHLLPLETATPSADLNKRLLEAAKTGKKGEVRWLIREGANVGFHDDHNRTPMSWAAESGYYDVVELLLKQYEVDYDCMDNANQIFSANMNAENESKAVVERMVEHFVSVYDSEDDQGRTPLLLALRGGHSHVALLLLRWYETQYKAEPKDEDGRTPLSWAAGNGHGAVVKPLLATAKANVESMDGSGLTPLAWAAGIGHEAVVKLLLAAEANVKSMDGNGQTPLSWAARNGHEAVVKLMLAAEADVKSMDGNGLTPLAWAAGNGHEAVVKLMLAAEADVESMDGSGLTPLS
jgi:ankyrin repeat protein